MVITDRVDFVDQTDGMPQPYRFALSPLRRAAFGNGYTAAAFASGSFAYLARNAASAFMQFVWDIVFRIALAVSCVVERSRMLSRCARSVFHIILSCASLLLASIAHERGFWTASCSAGADALLSLSYRKAAAHQSAAYAFDGQRLSAVYLFDQPLVFDQLSVSAFSTAWNTAYASLRVRTSFLPLRS